MAEKTKTTVKNVKVQEPLTEQYDIFVIVKNGKNYQIACGNNYMSKMTFASKKEAKAYIDSKPWELIINTTCYVYNLTNKTQQK